MEDELGVGILHGQEDSAFEYIVLSMYMSILYVCFVFYSWSGPTWVGCPPDFDNDFII